jgi:hypothetical protein
MMLRATASASSALAKRAALRSSRGAQSVATTQQFMAFHASSRRDEEAVVKTPSTSKGGLLGTGVSEWFALPLGIAFAVPALKYDWYIVNEETQLAACFIAFCVVVYTQGGDAIYKALDARAQTLLKEHRESEKELIEEMESLVEHLGQQLDIPEIMQDMNSLREETYAKLAAAGAIKPRHDLKIQVERILSMIALEESSNTDKLKMALMKEATAAVSEQFATSKQQKKAALDAAIATIKGGNADDPVRAAFISFFKEKGASAAKSKDTSLETAQRATLLAKANAVAESEGYFFRLDSAGVPKMLA